VRPAGEDIPAGHCAPQGRQRLRPQDSALCGAFGLTNCRGAPAQSRVSVFCDRNELVSPDAARAANCFYSNRFNAESMFSRWLRVVTISAPARRSPSLAHGLKAVAGCPRP